VVGVRLDLAGHPSATLALAAVSVPIRVLLTYAVPGALMLSPHPAPIAPEVNGSWFLWVVGTQSLAVAAATLASRHPGLATALAPLAVALRGIGVIWYLILAVLVTLRLLTTTANPYTFSPAYWIYMGATAIIVLAGARILTLPAQVPVMSAAAAVVSGLTYLLWVFGTWWVPLLVVFGVWRHVQAPNPSATKPGSGAWSSRSACTPSRAPSTAVPNTSPS